MYRYRGYYRKYRRFYPKKREYDNETMSYTYTGPIPNTGHAIKIVPPTTNSLQGKRLAKYFDINFITVQSESIGFLLLYVPEGTQINSVQTAIEDNIAVSIYEPNQNVIIS